MERKPSQDPGPRGVGDSPQWQLGEGVRYYADIHRTKRNGEGFRITFTSDGTTFRHVDSFPEIPAKAGDRIFVDVLPLQHTDGAIELLRRGVEVYHLRRTTLIAKRREELKMSKSTRKDIKVLMSIEDRWFRRVSEDFLVMRRKISAFGSLQRTHTQLMNKYRAVSDAERYTIKPAIKAIEVQMDELARQISEEAGRRSPAYNRLVDELGIRGSLTGMEALAELVTYVDFADSPLRGLKKLLGLYKPVRSHKKKYWRLYNGRLRQAIHRLSIACYGNIPNGRECWLFMKRLKHLAKTQTQG